MKRASGSKLLFYDLKGDGGKVQIITDLRCFQSGTQDSQKHASHCSESLGVPSGSS